MISVTPTDVEIHHMFHTLKKMDTEHTTLMLKTCIVVTEVRIVNIKVA